MTKTVREFLEDLSYGPLRQMAAGGTGAGSVADSEQARLVSFMNAGLIRLYARFNMLERELTIRMIGDRTLYPLRANHADTNTSLDAKFIADTVGNPFTDDIVRILSVFDDEQEELPLNDEALENSVFLPSPKTIQIPEPVDSENVYVLYQARHPRLYPEDLSATLYLPETLHHALESFMMHRFYSGMNGAENKQNAQEHLAMFESQCNETTNLDLVRASQLTSNTKFEQRGFV